MWLFALMALDALSAVPGLVWGTPLVLAACYLILFTGHACYRDLRKLIEDIEQQQAPIPDPEPEPAADVAEGFVSPTQSSIPVEVEEGRVNGQTPQYLENVMIMLACAEEGERDPDAPPLPPVDDGSVSAGPGEEGPAQILY